MASYLTLKYGTILVYSSLDIIKGGTMSVLTIRKMFKLQTLCMLLSLFALPLTAAFIQPDMAVQVANTWQRYNPSGASATTTGFKVERFTGTSFVPCNPSYDKTAADLPNIYLVKYNDGSFVLLSADDNALPVLGYSVAPAGEFRSYSPEFISWVANYDRQIDAIKEYRIELPDYTRQWNEMLRGEIRLDTRTDRAVQPLLSLTWDQGWPYNELCPADAAGPGGHVYAGCVATAMGMVMKYWNHPTTGVGSKSYYAYGYGYQNANFGATTYLWDQMPNSVGSSNIPVATLLYHCGVAVEMGYAADGSGAQSSDAADAMNDYFRYPNAQILNKMGYTDSAWTTLLQAQVDNGSPMYYSGSGSGGGHAFVIDGYDTAGYFHFNFGWSGYNNGYFYTSNINPGGSDFNQWQSAIVNSIPENYSIANTRIKMRSDIASVGDNMALTVSTNPILGSWNINHYEFQLLYDHQFLSYSGANLGGTIASGGNVTVLESEPGILSIVWNSTGKLIGAGDLINLNFTPNDAGEFLFDIGGMMLNSSPVTNVNYLMANVIAPVASLGESHISLQNVMHLGYQQVGTTEIRTTYLLPSWNVTHYQFNLGYDPAKLEFVGMDETGTLSEGCEPIVTLVSPGTVSVSCDSDVEFVGVGALIKAQFRAIGNGPSLAVTQVVPSVFFFNTMPITSVSSANFILSASSETEDVVAAIRPNLSISPNPVRDIARISFSEKAIEDTDLLVYNLRGQLVRKLTLERTEAEILWDGKDTFGRSLSSGVYFVRWEQGSVSGESKIIMLKQ